jgi:hypothetical protein
MLNEVNLNIFKKSKFRMKFQLDNADIAIISAKGLEKIRVHAENFVSSRLSDFNPKKDGKQTPFKGHPVFKAQHATATCCRGCLCKWHRIKQGEALTDAQIGYTVAFIMKWIDNQYTQNIPHRDLQIQPPSKQLSFFEI